MVSKSSKFRRNPNTLPYGTIRIQVNDIDLLNRTKRLDSWSI